MKLNIYYKLEALLIKMKIIKQVNIKTHKTCIINQENLSVYEKGVQSDEFRKHAKDRLQLVSPKFPNQQVASEEEKRMLCL